MKGMMNEWIEVLEDEREVEEEGEGGSLWGLSEREFRHPATGVYG